MDYSFVLGVAVVGISGFCVYTQRESANREKIEEVYLQYWRELKERQYSNNTGGYWAQRCEQQLRNLSILTPFARSEKKKTIELIRNLTTESGYWFTK